LTPLPPAAILLAVLTYFGFSTFDSLCRLVMLQGVPQANVLAPVFVLAILPVLGLVHIQGHWKNLKPHQPKLVILRALIAVVEFGLVFYTFRHLTLAESYTLFFTVPIWVALLGMFFLGEHLSRRQLAGIALGFLGAIVAIRPGASTLGLAHAAGLLQGLVGACSIVLMRHLGKRENTGTVLLAFLGAMTLANIALLRGWHPLTPAQMGNMVLASLALGLAHVCFFLAVKRAPAPLFAPFQYTQIFWMLVYGSLLFHEQIQPPVIAGLLLVSAGGWLLLKPASQGKITTS